MLLCYNFPLFCVDGCQQLCSSIFVGLDVPIIIKYVQLLPALSLVGLYPYVASRCCELFGGRTCSPYTADEQTVESHYFHDVDRSKPIIVFKYYK